MASKDLKGKKIALLVAKGFEEVELTEPKTALERAGAETEIVSIEKDKVRSWKFTDWGSEFEVDAHIADARAEDYDALAAAPTGTLVRFAETKG